MPRPKSPMISRDSAVRATLLIIKDEGYENFSLEKLARVMNVRSPSLYHHFSNRSDLLTEAARTLLAGVRIDPDPAHDAWHEWFVSLSMRTYDRIMANPRAAGLLFTYFPTTVVMPAHERGARILAEIGIPPADRWVTMRGLEKLLFGIAFADADDVVHGRDQLPRGIESRQWPFLVEAVDAGTADRKDLAERAIRLYLVGVGSLVETSPGSRRSRRTATT